MMRRTRTKTKKREKIRKKKKKKKEKKVRTSEPRCKRSLRILLSPRATA